MKIAFISSLFILLFVAALAQQTTADPNWIRPENTRSPSVWGIRNGIVIGLWPYGIETSGEKQGGGPRGLIRVGYEYKGHVYLINFIAIEPVVDGKMEFSEVSPSITDGKWGKLIWAGSDPDAGSFYPASITRGKISHPDSLHPATEELSIYLFMEKFRNGAHPYLRLSIRNDRPEELGLQLFAAKNSAKMERCALSATMGNYSRLRLIHLKDSLLDSRRIYKDYDDINFIDEPGKFPAEKLMRDRNDDFIVIAETNESFPSLADWPQSPEYEKRWNWRYRPFFKLSQYWRKEKVGHDPSLHLRVNGRKYYWSVASLNKKDYVAIPGGTAFENFELREKFYEGQKFYFALSRKSAHELLPEKIPSTKEQVH